MYICMLCMYVNVCVCVCVCVCVRAMILIHIYMQHDMLSFGGTITEMCLLLLSGTVTTLLSVGLNIYIHVHYGYTS